jgi:aminoglycoside/choline kinase family phosphotransferase
MYKKLQIDQAIILSAGFGARMRPLTLTTPKPLVKLNNQPIIYYILEELKNNKIKKCFINVHYLSVKIEKYIEKYKTLNKLKRGNNKLVLRDFHADNLFWLPERKNIKRIGLIDFQDALIGHETYDISSLLEDVRRDVSEEIKKVAIQEFIKIRNIKDEKKFYQNYKVLTAQRNAKIVGIFIRLAKRDNKIKYLKLVNKAMNIFLKSANDAKLEEVLQWIETYIPKHKLYLD